MDIGYLKEIQTKIVEYNAITVPYVMMIFITLGRSSQRSTALTAELEWTVTAMDKTCSNCKYAIGFGPLHNKAIYAFYAFCEKRSGVTKDKVLIVNRKNKCYAWEKRSDEDNA